MWDYIINVYDQVYWAKSIRKHNGKLNAVNAMECDSMYEVTLNNREQSICIT